MENKNNERFVKVTFTDEGIGIQGERVTKADILCAMLAVAAELNANDIQEAIRMIRKVGRFVNSMSEQEPEKKD